MPLDVIRPVVAYHAGRSTKLRREGPTKAHLAHLFPSFDFHSSTSFVRIADVFRTPRRTTRSDLGAAHERRRRQAPSPSSSLQEIAANHVAEWYHNPMAGQGVQAGACIRRRRGARLEPIVCLLGIDRSA